MSSGAQDFRTIAGIPSGPLDLEVLSGTRAFRALLVENLIGDIARVDVGWRGSWGSWSSRLGLEAKADTKRLVFVEGAHEDEPELFFRGGKEEWQKFCEKTLARDHKGRDPD